MKKKKFVNSLVTLASMSVGAMGSRVLAEQIPVSNMTAKRWGLLVGGIAGASALDRKSTLRRIGQDAAISVALTQAGYLLKDLLGSKIKEGSFFSGALGNPNALYPELDSTNFLSSYTPNYDFISEDVQEFAG